jgi:hypothetical protein
MAITIPSGRPTWRFMRYVRPPTRDSKFEPLHPLSPATRPLRLGIDVGTIPEPPEEGYLAGLLTRDEIEVHLLIPAAQAAPNGWTELLHEPPCHTVNFTNVADAGKFCDAAEFSVSTTRGKSYRAWSKARFFAVYQQLDEQDAPEGLPPLTLDERHRAAAYAAAAGAVGIDAIVTTAPTAGRTDVADNDVVVSVTPDAAVPLIGHYLRITSNPVVTVERGRLLGGGTWETTESTATIVNLYDWGTVSGLPYFDTASTFAAAAKGGPEAAEAFTSVRIRLRRAARAFDHLLAALSNPLDGKRKEDVAEAAAEAFDRELLYLAAAFDISGRAYQAMINPSVDRKKARGSLDSRTFVDKEVRTQYDESLLVDVKRLRVYAWLCKQLRNHIHDGVLAVDTHLGRSYGNTMNVALNLGLIPELTPGADNEMTQDHYQALGVWQTAPVWLLSGPSMVADLATTAFTLIQAALEYIEAFTKLIVRNKPANAPSASAFLGCVQARSDETERPPPNRAVFHQALFGLHPNIA